MTSEPYLSAVDIDVELDSKLVLDRLSLGIEQSEIVALLGPSGCGKTTLLRAYAGLQAIGSGQIILDGKDLTGTPPHQRSMGLMFQTHALFPHKTVAQNVAFGLEMAGVETSDSEERVSEVLDAVGLGGFGERQVQHLSGGEAQRVSLARTLAPRPSVVMLDEPLGSLDRALRESLAIDVRRALRSEGATAIVVTHDHDEAFTIADRAAIMNAGKIEQLDRPAELLRAPRSSFVATFVGMPKPLSAEVAEDGEFELLGLTLRRPEWAVGPCEIAIPATAISLESNGRPAVSGIVAANLFKGDHFQVHLDINGETLHLNHDEALTEGATTRVVIDADKLIRIAPSRN